MRIKKALSAMNSLRLAASHFDSSLLRQLWRAKRLHDEALFSLDDVLYWGLTDPAIPEDDLPRYMSREARVRLMRHFNSAADGALVDDKSVFYRFCEQCQLPTPRVYGSVYGTNALGEGPANPPYDAIDYTALPAADFIVKPSLGSKGRGIFFFHKDSHGRVCCDGSTLSSDEASLVFNDRANTDVLLVQEKAKPLASLAELSGSSGLQSLRVVSLLGNDDRVHLLFARFKFLVGDNQIDNFDDGKTGNLIAVVDVDSGHVTSCHRKVLGNIGLQGVTHHPDTGASLIMSLPQWEESVSLVERSARCFPTLRLLSWDIGLTETGPQLLEANQEWEIFSLAPYSVPDIDEDWFELLQLAVR